MTALWRRPHAGALIVIKQGAAQKKPSFFGE